MRRIILLVVTAMFVLGVGEASAQRRVNFQPCPPNTIRPDLLKGYPHWDPPGMGVAPVSEEMAELLSKITDQRERLELTSRFLQGRTLPADSPELIRAIMRTKFRVDLYLVFRLYKRDATNNDQLYLDLQKVQNPTFQKLWMEYTRPENLTEEVFVCGSPIPLTSDAPDGPNDRIQLSIKGWYVSTGYEPGVEDKLGRLGIKKISMVKAMPIPDDSPYKDEKTFDFFILPHCGNPGDEPGSEVLNPSVEVPGEVPSSSTPTPQITVGVLVSSKECDDGTTKKVPFCEGMPPATLEVRNLTTGTTRQLTYAREPKTERLMIRPQLTPGQYTCNELPIPGWKPEYPGGKCEFTITAGQETLLALLNVRDLPPPAPVPPVTPPAKPANTPPPSGGGSSGGSGMMFSLGVGGLFGQHLSTYSGTVLPGTGDAAQKNLCANAFLSGRLEPRDGNGLFVAANGTVWGWTGEKKAKDVWFVKERDSDTSVLKRLEVMAGWRFGIFTPFVGYQRACILCENYTAQGADTITERIFSGPIVGTEVGVIRNSSAVRARITYSHWVKRESWTQQEHPSATFPRVNHPDQDGRSVGLRLEFEKKIVGPVYGMGAFDYLGVFSHRPNTFAADERVTTFTGIGGITFRFGGN